MLETESEILVHVALPGVSADCLEITIEGAELVFAGIRLFPVEMQTAIIHRLEIPHGRFERRVRLPAGTFGSIRRSAAGGCVLIALQKLDEPGG